MSELTPITRIEEYLDAIVDGGTPPLEDITRVETFLEAIYNNTPCALTPVTRIEMYLGKISGQDIELPEPVTRVEMYLASIAGMDVILPDEPVTRIEMYLADWAEGSNIPWETLSGAIVSFIAPKAHALKEVVVDIEPVQAGSGDPSPDNVRPISGWTGVRVWDAGGNLFDPSVLLNGTGWEESDGVYTGYSSVLYSAFQNGIPFTFKFKENTRYTFSLRSRQSDGDIGGARFIIHYTDNSSSTALTFDSNGGEVSVTSNANKTIARITFNYGSGKLFSIWDVMLCEQSTASDYEAYQGNTYTVTWEDEVFGGDFNFIDGKGNGNRNNAVFDGTEYVAAYGNLYVVAKTFPNGTGTYLNFLCSHAPVASYVNYANASKNTFQFTASYFGVSTVEEFKAFLAEQYANGTPVTINYPLDTSTEFEVTPTPISALKGNNVMWADTGDITVTFRGTPVVEPDEQPLQALNLLLGGSYRNNQTQEDVPDEEALNILLGGENR